MPPPMEQFLSLPRKRSNYSTANSSHNTPPTAGKCCVRKAAPKNKDHLAVIRQNNLPALLDWANQSFESMNNPKQSHSQNKSVLPKAIMLSMQWEPTN